MIECGKESRLMKNHKIWPSRHKRLRACKKIGNIGCVRTVPSTAANLMIELGSSDASCHVHISQSTFQMFMTLAANADTYYG